MPNSKQVAGKILKIITDTYLLGSANIQPLSRSKSVYDDRVFINKSLFFRKERQRSLEAVVERPLKDLRNERILEYRRENLLMMLEDKNQDYQEKTRQFYHREAELSASAMAANCGEMCCFGLKYVMESKEFITNQSLEVMKFTAPFEHYFLVLNRDPTIPVGDYKRWNSDTLIIDPWLNKVMTLQEFDQFWKKNFPIINTYPETRYSCRKFKRIPKTLSFNLEKYLDFNSLKENRPGAFTAKSS
jgi:hypothetical protein